MHSRIGPAMAPMAILMISYCAIAQSYLSGELTGSLGPGDYIIPSNLYVRPGDTLTIQKGTALHFESYCGLIVRGVLICNGTVESPVIFTSIKDNPSDPLAGQPTPFDWNGITAEEEAALLQLNNTDIRFSVFGLNIKAVSTTAILENVRFSNNGYRNLTRSGKIIMIELGASVNYLFEPAKEVNLTEAKKPGDEKKIKEAAPKPARNRLPVWKKTALLSSGIGVAVGSSLWAGGHYMAERTYRDYQKSTVTSRTDNLREQTQALIPTRNAGIVLASLSAAGFALTFSF
jgi:hypothetical protein